MKAKEMFEVAAMLVVAVAMVVGFIYGMRWFSNAATPISLHTPKPGITCATMVTSDGAAISCWKD